MTVEPLIDGLGNTYREVKILSIIMIISPEHLKAHITPQHPARVFLGLNYK